MISVSDERVQAATRVLIAKLREILEAAGPGHAVGYRLKPPPLWERLNPDGDAFVERMEYETHLVELDADGDFEACAGFHYVALPAPAI